jgi:23S rRNA (uracil1939-C5)-methyltransferase
LGSENSFTETKWNFLSNSRWLTEAEIGSTEDLRTEMHLVFTYRKCGQILDINKYLQEDPSNAIRNEVRDFANANGRLSSTQEHTKAY